MADVGPELAVLVRDGDQLVAAQNKITSVRGKDFIRAVTGIDFIRSNAGAAQSYQATSETIRRNFHAERQILSTNRQVGIVDRRLDPHSRTVAAIIKQLCAKRAYQSDM